MWSEVATLLLTTSIYILREQFSFLSIQWCPINFDRNACTIMCARESERVCMSAGLGDSFFLVRVYLTPTYRECVAETT